MPDNFSLGRHFNQGRLHIVGLGKPVGQHTCPTCHPPTLLLRSRQRRLHPLIRGAIDKWPDQGTLLKRIPDSNGAINHLEPFDELRSNALMDDGATQRRTPLSGGSNRSKCYGTLRQLEVC